MAVCSQNLTLSALSSRSALSELAGALFKKVRSLFEHASHYNQCLESVEVTLQNHLVCLSFVLRSLDPALSGKYLRYVRPEAPIRRIQCGGMSLTAAPCALKVLHEKCNVPMICLPSLTPPKGEAEFKKQIFVDAVMSKVLHDLTFNLNETRESRECVDIFLVQLALIFPVTQLDVDSEILT